MTDVVLAVTLFHSIAAIVMFAVCVAAVIRVVQSRGHD